MKNRDQLQQLEKKIREQTEALNRLKDQTAACHRQLFVDDFSSRLERIWIRIIRSIANQSQLSENHYPEQYSGHHAEGSETSFLTRHPAGSGTIVLSFEEYSMLIGADAMLLFLHPV